MQPGTSFILTAYKAPLTHQKKTDAIPANGGKAYAKVCDLCVSIAIACEVDA
jgi:hypothetical protein